MKRILILLTLVILLTACTLPGLGGNAASEVTQAPATQPVLSTAPPAEATTAVPPTTEPIDGSEMNLGGVYMIVPGCLPVTVSGVIVQAQPANEAGMPYEIWPQHRQFSYAGYPLSGKFFDPIMRVYPVAEYAALQDFVNQQVSDMQTLLSNRPAQIEASIPFLPTLGAAQVFHASVQYIDFQNGAGVRFLTEYAQYSAPYNNHDLFYAFQGLTADGKYWVSAMFPINHPILPATYDSTEVPAGGIAIPQMTSATYVEDMNTYYVNMKALIESQPADSFTPAMDCLDRYIASLSIGD